MAEEKIKTLKALHDLVATENDAAEGYGKAAKGLRNQTLSDCLAQIAAERLQFAQSLSEAVAKLGDQPRLDLHEGGILHRGWVDLDTRIRPRDEGEVIQNCLDGDEGTRKHYEHALAQQLPQELRPLIEKQQTAVERDLQFLRDSLRKSHTQHA